MHLRSAPDWAVCILFVATLVRAKERRRTTALLSKFEDGDPEARVKFAKSEQAFLGKQKGDFLLAHLDVSAVLRGRGGQILLATKTAGRHADFARSARSWSRVGFVPPPAPYFVATGTNSTSRRKGRYFGKEQQAERRAYVVRKAGMKESKSKTYCYFAA